MVTVLRQEKERKNDATNVLECLHWNTSFWGKGMDI